MNKIDNPRILAAKLRNGDYAHAGEEESIDLVLRDIFEILHKDYYYTNKDKLNILDVGCGLGGTANYIKKITDYNVYGIDVDKKAINHAKNNYKNLNFYNCDILEIKNIFHARYFDIVYMFNAFYAFPHKSSVLKLLSEITKKNGLLVIFDYTCKNIDNIKPGLVDFSKLPMQPVMIDEFENILNGVGWELVKIINLDQKYIIWYTNFINKLHIKKDELLRDFTEEAYNELEHNFLELLNNMHNKNLGGAVIYARLK